MTCAGIHRRYELKPRRRGAVLIVLLAVFAVTIGLAGVWTRRIVADHRQQRRAAQRVQASWLAEAGVRRAAAQVIANPDYQGEEWSIAAEELGQSYAAVVILRIEPSADADASQIVAEARCPEQNARVRITRTVLYTPPKSEPAP
jgi:hypothetical protein